MRIINTHICTCQKYWSRTIHYKNTPVSFASKTFTQGESNKSTMEHKLPGIYWGDQHSGHTYMEKKIDY